MTEIDCANCGEPNAVCNWGDVMVCDDCSHTLGGDLVGELQSRLDEAKRGWREERARAEKAEAERDEARRFGTWVECYGPDLWCIMAAPNGARSTPETLGVNGWGLGATLTFDTSSAADAALARAPEWWT